ncbi:MAG: metal-dependent hydrolase [Acidobacteriota bacterium]
MATPLAHGLAGYAVGLLAAGSRQAPDSMRMAAAVAAALAADLDIVPGLLVGTPARFHQGVSHSLAAAVILATLGALVAAFRSRPPGPIFLVVFAAYTSHLLLDIAGSDRRPPYGIPLLWPLTSATFQAPFPVLMGMSHAAHADDGLRTWLSGVLSWHNVRALAVEAALMSPLVVGVRRMTRRHRADAAVPGAIYPPREPEGRARKVPPGE